MAFLSEDVLKPCTGFDAEYLALQQPLHSLMLRPWPQKLDLQIHLLMLSATADLNKGKQWSTKAGKRAYKF